MAGMIRVCAARLQSPMGDVRQSAQALGLERARPGILEGALLENLYCLLEPAPWQPDLLLFASTKGDGPLWMEHLDAGLMGRGGPAWIAAELGQHFSCPGLAVSAACASGPAAVALAGMLMEGGQAGRVLVVAGDRLMPMVSEGFAALGAIDSQGPRPFDAQRAGLQLGEVVAALWLEVYQPDGQPHCCLSGWGLSSDAHHLTAPERQGRGLYEAARQAAAGLLPDLIISHGTGTRFNDAAEAEAYYRLAPEVPITGWKGGLGHSLGSCGLGELALAATFLEDQCGGAEAVLVPGIQGFQHSDIELPCPFLPPGLHARSPQRILSANAGFAGINAAVSLCRSSNSPQLPRRQARRASLAWRAELAPDGCRILLYHDAEPEQRHRPWGFAWDDPQALPRLSARQVSGCLDPSWGKMDLASRLLLALAEWSEQELPSSAAMLLLSDALCAESDRRCEQARREGSPDRQRFPYTLPSTPLGELSIRKGIQGPALALPGVSDAWGRRLAQLFLDYQSPMVLLARIEADRPPHCAWLEAWVTQPEC